MSNIINLNQFKKRKMRAEKQQKSSENRILFGRTKAEKAFDKNKAQYSANFLHQHALDKSDRTPKPPSDQTVADHPEHDDA